MNTLQTTTGGTPSVTRIPPDDDTVNSCYTPKSDSTYEPSTNYAPSHDTPATTREPTNYTAVPELVEEVTTPVMTQQSSPAVESAHVSFSQPSTPEEDQMITKGFQEVCQVRI